MSRKPNLPPRRGEKRDTPGATTMIATMEADPTKAYNLDDATGFTRLNALRLKVAAKVHGKKK